METQPFRVYQGIEWICDENSSVDNQVNGVRRVREMIEMDKTDDVIKLGIPNRLIELLEKTQDELLQVLAIFCSLQIEVLSFFPVRNCLGVVKYCSWI